MAIVDEVKHFRPYLYSRKFTLITDHRPLTGLNSLKDHMVSRLARCKIKVSEFDYEIIDKSGKINVNAEASSRTPVTTLLTTKIFR